MDLRRSVVIADTLSPLARRRRSQGEPTGCYIDGRPNRIGGARGRATVRGYLFEPDDNNENNNDDKQTGYYSNGQLDSSAIKTDAILSHALSID